LIPALGKGRIHLLGICGTAMASLAGLLKERGCHVTGSDEGVYPPMSDLLEELGIDARTPYAPSNLPDACDLVIVGNALSRGNPELEAVLERRLAYASMPEVLKEVFLRDRTPLVVAGTHGKTTTSSLSAWVLERSGLDPGFLVGGVPLDFGRSFRLGSGEPFVVEGDEYDTAYFDKGPKFMHYLPQVAVLGNVEFDHADIYSDLEAVKRAFRLFVRLVPRNGLVVVGKESEIAMEVTEDAPCPVTTFSAEASAEADWMADILDASERGTRLRVSCRGRKVVEIWAPFWGRAGVRNLLAATAVGAHFGASSSELGEALESFKGVRRRMEIRGTGRGVVVVDDFAHHPTAIRETLTAARSRWPERKLWGIFEPRSFTVRSRYFQDELAEALAEADEVVVAQVLHSTRLAAEDELSEEQLVRDTRARGTSATFVPEHGEIVRFLNDRARDGDVILLMSNGSFGGIHDKLLDALVGNGA
jgi:UDP-N-acetylmuramate: L-alanyl-gamma-D-glutamyl-meso-diaminopimelate ligase